jgi:hypothetical protein
MRKESQIGRQAVFAKQVDAFAKFPDGEREGD